MWVAIGAAAAAGIAYYFTPEGVTYFELFARAIIGWMFVITCLFMYATRKPK